MNLQNLAPTKEEVTYAFSSELMKNYVAALPVDAHHNLEVINQNNNPAIFSIGSDDSLYIILSENNTPSGWVQYNLSQTLGKVTAFDVYQDDSGKFCIGIGIDYKFYKSEMVDFSYDFKNLNPETFWKLYEIPDPDATINQVEVLEDVSLIATEEAGKDAAYYTISANDKEPKKYKLPENGAKIIAMALGTVYRRQGAFLLYTVGNNRSMLFQSFPAREDDKTSKHFFEPPGTVNDFALVLDKKGNNQLITSTNKGIYLFKDPRTSSTTIVDESSEINFKKIEATQKDSYMSIWVIGETKGQHKSLYFITNQYYDPSSNDYITKWAAPISMKPDVEQFDCVRGKNINNHLFLIDSSNELTHFWQAAEDTLWKTGNVPINDVGKVDKINSYILQVQFHSKKMDTRFEGSVIQVSSSSPAYLSLNGASYQLDEENYAEITLDVTATLFIVNKVDSISAPNIYIKAPFLEDKLEINLAENAIQTLKNNLKTGSDLKNAKKQNGKPLLPTDKQYTDSELDYAANSIQSLIYASEYLNTQGASNSLRNSPIDSFAISISPESGVKYKENDEAYSHFNTLLSNQIDVANANFKDRSLFSDLGHTFGSVIHWLDGAVHEAVDVFITIKSEVVNAVITIGEDVYHFVLETAQEIYYALEWLFKKIYIFFEDLIEYLAFLFEWGDILDTKNALKAMVNSSLDSMADNVKQIKGAFNNWANEAKTKLGHPELVKGLDFTIDDMAQKVDEVPDDMADPRITWVGSKMHYLNHGFMGEDTSLQNAPVSLQNDPASLLDDIWNAIKEEVEDIVKELSNIYDKSIEFVEGKITIGAYATYLLETVAALALDIFQKIVDIVLDAIYSLIKDAKEALNAKITIPFFSALYDDISGSDLTILDLSCLLIAIPATVASKISSGKAPMEILSQNQLKKEVSKIFENFNFSKNPTDNANNIRLTSETIDALHQVASYFVAGCRLIRFFTFPLVSFRSKLPGDYPFTEKFLDSILRWLTVLFLVIKINAQKEIDSIKLISSFLGYSIFVFIDGVFYNSESPYKVNINHFPSSIVQKIGSELNLFGFLNSILTTGFGIWGIILFLENSSKLTKFQSFSEISIIVFQLPAIPGFLFNAAAKNTQSPPAQMLAGLTIMIRDVCMLAASLSELGVAIEE